MNKYLIHHHLGIGDHIVCNAIVRKKYFDLKNIVLVVLKHNLDSVKSLYQDIDISFLPVSSDKEAEDNYKNYEVFRIGFEKCNIDNWEKSLYDQLNLDYSIRYKDFVLPRNFERENSLFKKINPPDKFAICNVRSTKMLHNFPIQTSLPLIQMEFLTNNIFDWTLLIEKASEIHMIDSAPFQLVKQLNLDTNKFFYDTRSLDSSRTRPTFNQDWKIITC
jgi:hypothetical protein